MLLHVIIAELRAGAYVKSLGGACLRPCACHPWGSIGTGLWAFNVILRGSRSSHRVCRGFIMTGRGN